MYYWAVGLFGVVGALLRYLTGMWAHNWWASPFPLGTFLINLLGSLVLGWFSTWAASQPQFPAWIRLGIGTGLIGAFTTFSTFSVETVSLFKENLPGYALLYTLASLVGGFLCAWIGYEIARAQLLRKTRSVNAS
ncbi:fluoride efflux transporter CrcB [Cohnella thermotolerans]|jgi:CrcB protein|uniref:fluoride efflux transporter CrcB n=1 Tax=Cohnella thermotolerans TaxID=329858 RepID=UPI00047A9B06|nr:fluoride efflux transporter CrcB [Cohnella thermotolerans]